MYTHFHCGCSGTGQLFPIVIILSCLSDIEMPKEDFITQEVRGLTINGGIDIRSNVLGYIVFMRKKCDRSRFYDWYYNEISHPQVKEIRKQYTNFEFDEGDVPLELKTVNWADSDIEGLKEHAHPKRVKVAYNKRRNEL